MKRVKLIKLRDARTRIIAIPTSLLIKAGLDPEKELYAERTVLGFGQILLTIREKERFGKLLLPKTREERES